MAVPKQKKKEKLSDKLAKRDIEDDPKSRTGRGGRRRANRIDDYVNQAVTGRKKK